MYSNVTKCMKIFPETADISNPTYTLLELLNQMQTFHKKKKVSSYCITSPSSLCYPTILRAYRSVAVWATITLWTLTYPSLTMGTIWTYWGPSFFLIRTVMTLPHPKWSVEALRFVWWDVGLKVDRDHAWSRKTTCTLGFKILHTLYTLTILFILDNMHSYKMATVAWLTR